VLPLSATTIRLFLHVFAATIWVGGQLTLGALLPTVRTLDPRVRRDLARGFNRVAWPAFGLLVISGIWNVLEVHVGATGTRYQITLFFKLLLVAVSGIAAFLHLQARTRAGLAVWGAVGALSSVAALFFGVWLRNR
jgi:putative copper export protein